MVVAFILITCDLGFEQKVIEDLKQFDLIKEIHGTFGAFDIIAKVEAESVDVLRYTIAWQIRKIDRIRSTLTIMGIDGQEFIR